MPPAAASSPRSAPAQQAGTLYAAALAASAAARLQGRARAGCSGWSRAPPATTRRPRGWRACCRPRSNSRPATPPKAASAARRARPRTGPRCCSPAQAAVATGAARRRWCAPLRDWVAPHPRDATAWRTLANLYGAQNDTLRAVRADAEANVAMLDYAGARDRFKAAQELMRRGRTARRRAAWTTTRRRSSTRGRARSMRAGQRSRRRICRVER